MTKRKEKAKEVTVEPVNAQELEPQVPTLENPVPVEPSVVPAEDVEIRDADHLKEDDPAKAEDVEQVSKDGVEQEKIPGIPEVDSEVKDSKGKKPGTPTRTGDQKEKPADQPEDTAVSRHDHGISPQVIEGRRSEYPRG